MFRHFYEIHNLFIIENELDFRTTDDFASWLFQEEKNTKAKYVVKNKRKYPEYLETNYICHRSGHYKPEGQGMRSLKAHGSVKINAFCPASIKLIENRTALGCKILYISTHVGHSVESNLQHLGLSKKDRDEISNEIISGVPFNSILENYNSNPDKHHSLKRKYLNNIRYALIKLGYDLPCNTNLSTIDLCPPTLENEQGNTDEVQQHKNDSYIPDPAVNINTNTEQYNIEVLDANADLQSANKTMEMNLVEEKEEIKKYLSSVVDSVDSEEKLEELRNLLCPVFSKFPSLIINGPLDVQYFINNNS